MYDLNTDNGIAEARAYFRGVLSVLRENDEAAFLNAAYGALFTDSLVDGALVRGAATLISAADADAAASLLSSVRTDMIENPDFVPDALTPDLVAAGDNTSLLTVVGRITRASRAEGASPGIDLDLQGGLGIDAGGGATNIRVQPVGTGVPPAVVVLRIDNLAGAGELPVLLMADDGLLYRLRMAEADGDGHRAVYLSASGGIDPTEFEPTDGGLTPPDHVEVTVGATGAAWILPSSQAGTFRDFSAHSHGPYADEFAVSFYGGQGAYLPLLFAPGDSDAFAAGPTAPDTIVGSEIDIEYNVLSAPITVSAEIWFDPTDGSPSTKFILSPCTIS
jgi:hypothetical protein